MARSSLYPTDVGCIICHSPYVETHHVFPGSGRRMVSDREGCTAPLCHAHHNGSNFGVHFDRKLDRWLRADCQRRWEEREMAETGVDADEARRLFIVTFHESFILQ